MNRRNLSIGFLLMFSAGVLIYMRYSEKHHDPTNSDGDHKWEVRNIEPAKGYMIPNDDTLAKMNPDQLTIVYWRYINTLQILCSEQMRFGSFRDGGKEVCLDPEYRPKQNSCLVYSFGSNLQFDFEEAVYREFNCEIHTFDPSVPMTEENVKRIPKEITYHNVGVYGLKSNKMNWNMDYFPFIRDSLGHSKRVIDIVKMDIESSEWDVIEHMLSTGEIYSVKQVCVEWHLGSQKSDFRDQSTMLWTYYLQIFRKLYEAGFRMFMHERGLYHQMKFHHPYPIFTSLVEVSYINTRFLKD